MTLTDKASPQSCCTYQAAVVEWPRHIVAELTLQLAAVVGEAEIYRQYFLNILEIGLINSSCLQEIFLSYHTVNH